MKDESGIKKSILVILPTFNEGDAVLKAIEELKEISLDCVVVDGFSTDKTVEIAKQANISVAMRKYKGKSDAIRTGFELAEKRGKEYIAIMDCDGSFNATDLELLVPFIKENQMVVGSRPYEKIVTSRRMANQIMNLWFWLFFGKTVMDMGSGMRIIHARPFQSTFDPTGFNVEPHLWSVAVKRGYSIKEVPVSYFPRIGKSKSNPIHLVLALFEIFRIKFFFRP